MCTKVTNEEDLRQLGFYSQKVLNIPFAAKQDRSTSKNPVYTAQDLMVSFQNRRSFARKGGGVLKQRLAKESFNVGTLPFFDDLVTNLRKLRYFVIFIKPAQRTKRATLAIPEGFS